MSMRERIADAIGSADRLAPTDREVHLEQADAVLATLTASEEVEAALEDFLRRAEQEMAPKLRESAVAVSLMPENSEGDAKLWVELGAMICLGKPIIVGRLDGRGEVPPKLAVIADAIVETPEELADAIQRLADKPVRDPRWTWLRRLNDVRSVCFGDGRTTSGAVKGEDDRSYVADVLNHLQADLGIPSGVEPSA